jgi:hypothetical protein
MFRSVSVAGRRARGLARATRIFSAVPKVRAPSRARARSEPF